MNFIKTESIATGLVKPKTTALFFDKLWLPTLPNNLHYVPQEILFTDLEKDFQNRLSLEYWRGQCDNRSWDNIFRHILECLKATNDSKFADIEFPDEYIFNSNRNATLLGISDLCKKEMNICLTPIFIEKPILKGSIAGWVSSLSWELERRAKKPLDKRIDVLEVCIRNIPCAIEDKLHWHQVLEIRQDEKSLESIKRFKRWLNADFVGKSESEIIESIEESIDDYRFAMKKHGVITTVGSLSTLLTSAASTITALTGNSIGMISTCLVVNAGIFTFTTQKIAEYIEKKREPIAFLYDIEKIIKNEEEAIIDNEKRYSFF